VIAEERGIIDTKAQVNYENVNFKADYSPTDRVSTFLRVGYFKEERDNAKVTTFANPDGGFTPEANDSQWKALSAGVRASLPDQSDLQASVFLDYTRFNSNFLAVPAATPLRSVSRVTTIQHVPTDAVGALVQWSKAISTQYLVSAGTDFRHIKGATEELGMNTTNGTSPITSRDGPRRADSQRDVRADSVSAGAEAVADS
jgi:hypothetical protein